MKRLIMQRSSFMKRLAFIIDEKIEFENNSTLSDAESDIFKIKNENSQKHILTLEKYITSNLIKINNKDELNQILNLVSVECNNLLKVYSKICNKNFISIDRFPKGIEAQIENSILIEMKNVIRIDKSDNMNTTPSKIHINAKLKFYTYKDAVTSILEKIIIKFLLKINVDDAAVADCTKCNIYIDTNNLSEVGKTELIKILNNIKNHNFLHISEDISNNIFSINVLDKNTKENVNLSSSDPNPIKINEKKIKTTEHLEFASFSDAPFQIVDFNILDQKVLLECLIFEPINIKSGNKFYSDINFNFLSPTLINTNSNINFENNTIISINNNVKINIENIIYETTKTKALVCVYQLLEEIDTLTMDDIKEQTIDCLILIEK